MGKVKRTPFLFVHCMVVSVEGVVQLVEIYRTKLRFSWVIPWPTLPRLVCNNRSSDSSVTFNGKWVVSEEQQQEEDTTQRNVNVIWERSWGGHFSVQSIDRAGRKRFRLKKWPTLIFIFSFLSPNPITMVLLLLVFKGRQMFSGCRTDGLRSGMMMLRGCLVDFYKKHEVCGYACCSLAWAFKETEMLQGMASKDHEERRRRRIRCILII